MKILSNLSGVIKPSFIFSEFRFDWRKYVYYINNTYIDFKVIFDKKKPLNSYFMEILQFNSPRAPNAGRYGSRGRVRKYAYSLFLDIVHNLP